MKIESYYQQRKCSPGTLKFLAVYGLRGYSRRFDQQGSVNESGVVKHCAIFTLSRSLSLPNLFRQVQNYCVVICTCSISMAFHWHWNRWPRMTWMAILCYILHVSQRYNFCMYVLTFRQNCSEMNRAICTCDKTVIQDFSFWRHKVCVLIRWGSLERERQTGVPCFILNHD